MRITLALLTALVLAACSGSSATVTETPEQVAVDTAETAEVITETLADEGLAEELFEPAEGYPHPVVYWEVCGENWEELIAFYGELFGWQIQDMESETMDYANVFSADLDGGIPGGICRPQGFPGYLTIYVYTEDLQVTLDEAVALGATVIVPPMVLEGGVGSMALFMDSDFRMMGIYSTEGFVPSEEMEEPVFADNPVVHFELGTPSADSVRQFYTDLFGWDLVTDEEYGYTEVFAGGGVGIDGGIAQLPADAEVPAYTTLYVAVPDLAAMYARAIELGAQPMLEPALVAEGVEIAMFGDPAGNPIGIIQAWEPDVEEGIDGAIE